MTIQELLIELQRLNVRLSSEDGKLKVTAPKGALTPALQQEMSARKAELLAWLAAAGPSPAEPAAPVRLDRREALPLSFTQERLWFLQQLAPASTAYHIVNAFRLHGPLDVAALERSWTAVCERHEVLRTRVAAEEGRPFILVDPVAAGRSFTLLNLADRDAAAQAEACARLIDDEAVRPFDLERGPLATITVAQLGGQEHLVVLRMHHIVSDQWSMQVLARDVAAFYNHYAAAQPLQLPELPIQYADYAAWQRGWLQGDVWERELAYWRGQLAGVPSLNLLTDSPRPAVAGTEGARVNVPLPAPLLERVQALAAQSGATPFMVLLAGFALLLHRYSAQTDLAIATPVANRRRSDVEQIVGAFINTLVLRIPADGDPTFAELLGRARHVTMDAFDHQDAPFERLVAALHPARDPSQAPLAQVMFNLLADAASPAATFTGITGEPILVERHHAMFDLTFIVRLGAEPVIVAEYRSDLFAAPTIERMVAHYVRLLEQVTAAPQAKLSDVELLTDAERALLAGWNDTAAAYDLESGVEQLVAAQARRTPDATAVVCGRRSLSYGELESRSTTLAAYLQGRGLGPESLVGVCLERGPDLLVALLGILKAGAAYVPLDPAFPAQRLAIMVEDSTLSLIITDDASEVVLPENDAALLRIDAEWDRVAAAPALVTPAVSGSHLAYVLYTSGSTGRPKGVQVPRRAFTNFIRSMQAEPGIAAGDVLLAVTTLSFDIAGLELFLPLTVGGTVALATREQASDGLDLAELMASSGATLMQATPATWRLLLDSGWQGSPRLTALCGGEPMPRELAVQLLEKTAALWNMYGPTETTVWSTLEKVLPGARITVGHPIANTQVHVVDERLRLVPVGVPGELCIGGDGVARGYLGRPELTSEKFVADPFTAGGRSMYRTGDLARWLADGRLELLGRADQQVKVRGFRIELGEIEGMLERHDAVRQAVCSVYDDGAGDKRLVAYLVYEEGADTTPSELRRFLRGELPDYMVPSLFVDLPALPLTANGKVDRKALPPPLEPQRQTGERIAPRTEMERLIAGLWRDAVGAADVSVHDNFFDIGGHSLLSMQVIARLEKEIGVRLQPARFVIDSLEQLSAACEQMLARTPAAAAPRSGSRA